MPKPKNGPGGHGGAPRGGFQKPKNMGKTVSKLFSYLGKSKGLLVLVVIFVLLSSVGMIASSYFIKIVIDNYLVPMTNGTMTPDIGAIALSLSKMAMLFIFSAISAYAYARIMIKVSQGTVNTIRRDLFDKMQDLPISYFDYISGSGKFPVPHRPRRPQPPPAGKRAGRATAPAAGCRCGEIRSRSGLRRTRQGSAGQCRR